MGALDVAEATRRAGDYPHAVVSFVGADGYPVSVAASFTADPATGTVEVGPLPRAMRPDNGQDTCLIFSHIRPRPGVGYDERRYVNLWGPAARSRSGVRVTAERATGWDEQETPFVEYAERNVGRAHGYFAEVGARPRLSIGWRFFLATRVPFLTATLVPIGLGGVVAARHHAFSTVPFVLALIAGALVHLGLNVANDLFDDASGADAANVTPTPFSGGSRVIQYGLVSRRTMVTLCASFYAVAAAIGLYLAATRSVWLLLVGAAGIVLSLAYTAPPARLVHRGLGEPVTALGFGPLMAVGAYLATAGSFHAEALYVSLPVGVLVALILYVNQVPDRLGDAAAGKRTLIVRWPKQRVIAVYLAAVAATFALIVAGALGGVIPLATLLALLAAPLAFWVHRGLQASYDAPYGLLGAMAANIGLHLLTGLLLIAGYGIFVATR